MDDCRAGFRDLDCALTRDFRRKLGVLDWARRLFSPSTTRPSTTSPAVIRRRAQDAALDVLARPSPTSKRRLDISPSKPKRAPFAALRHRHKGRRSRPRSAPDEDGVLHRAPLGGWPVRGRRRVGARGGRRGRLLDDVPGDRGHGRGLRRRARVLGRGELARGAAGRDDCRGRAFAAPVIAPLRRRRRRAPPGPFKPTLDAYEQCLEPACSSTPRSRRAPATTRTTTRTSTATTGAPTFLVTSPATNHGSGVGWCMSTLDEKVGCGVSRLNAGRRARVRTVTIGGHRLVRRRQLLVPGLDCPCMDFDLSPVVITRAGSSSTSRVLRSVTTTSTLYMGLCRKRRVGRLPRATILLIRCHYEAQLAELGETCPTQTCVEVLATPGADAADRRPPHRYRRPRSPSH